MFNKIFNLLGGRRMIVESGRSDEWFGGTAAEQQREPGVENFGLPVEIPVKYSPAVLHFSQVTTVSGTAAFSMSVTAFNSQLG